MDLGRVAGTEPAVSATPYRPAAPERGRLMTRRANGPLGCQREDPLIRLIGLFKPDLAPVGGIERYQLTRNCALAPMLR